MPGRFKKFNSLCFQYIAISAASNTLFPPKQSASNNGDLGTFVSNDEDNEQTDIDAIDRAINLIGSLRSELGAVENNFQNIISNLSTVSENVTSARSRIIDTDYAIETANLTRNQIVQQAGTAVLAQANQRPQTALALLSHL